MDLVTQKYVSITTLRRSGEAVSSPVWIAPLGDGTFGFTTDGDSGKVKRLRNNNAVTLRPCTMRGAVAPDAPVVEATAVAVEGEAYASVHRAIAKKYGFVVTLMGIPAKITKLFGKQDLTVGIVITLSPTPTSPES